MIIVDWSAAYISALVLYFVLTLVFLAALIYLSVLCVKTFKKKATILERFLICVITAVPLILLCCTLHRTVVFAKYNFVCISGDYEIEAGSFEIDSIKRNDYRDNEAYDIVLTVNGMNFYSNFTPDEKQMLTSNSDKNAEVRYYYMGNDIFIYQIVLLS